MPAAELVAAARAAAAAQTRALSAAERDALVRNGCTAEDWGAVRVAVPAAGRAASPAPPAFHFDAVQRCCFSGRVVLGAFGQASSAASGGARDATSPPTPLAATARAGWRRACPREGVRDSHLADCTVMAGASVSRCHLVQNCVVMAGATVVGCGTVGSPYGPEGESSFGNGRVVSVGPETGGREAVVCAVSEFERVARAYARHTLSTDAAAAVERDEADAAAYGRRCAAPFAVIGPGATLTGCPRVARSLVGAGVTVEASVVVDSTLGGTESGAGAATVVSASHVESSVVQPGCTVTQNAAVTGSLMCAASHVRRHATLQSSVLASFSSVEQGEVGSSLVGPLVGFHHQALLVAAFWPAGRGNIGYGANVGSNHTGKRNDQEIWPGEGVFYGLGACVKYPCNLSESPYTIVAAGVTLLPQRVAMPFSLINTASEHVAGVSPALNDISPGWVLASNAYTVIRNECKFSGRQRGARGPAADNGADGSFDGSGGASAGPMTHAGPPRYTARVIRGEHVRLVAAAASRLRALKGKHRYTDASGEPIYTDTDLPGGAGLGKSVLREAARVDGIRAYDACVEMFALKTVWTAVHNGRIARDECERRLRGGKTPAVAQRSGGDGVAASNSGACTSASGCDAAGVSALPVAPSLSGLQCDASEMDDFNFAVELVRTHDFAGTGGGFDELCERLAGLAIAEAKSIRESKRKDFKRGSKIIPDYESVQAPLDDDAVVQAAEAFAVRVVESVEARSNTASTLVRHASL